MIASHGIRLLISMHEYHIVDEASDLEACQLLTANAKNLTLAISETLNCTRSACIRVTKETREELGLTQPHDIIVEALPIMQSLSHGVRVAIYMPYLKVQHSFGL